ncbi:MAG: enediyne biosynthesis protein UnbU [Longimicrobiaceae bacterium]
MAETNGRDAARLGGLRRFAVAITVLNLLGHTVLGFEQSWLQPLVALAAAYLTEAALEGVDAAAARRPPRWRGGRRATVDFFLSAHISGLAVAMLLYANQRLGVFAFAAAAAIASKALFRLPAWQGGRHFFNPSNLGITATLLLFPWVGISPPYHFTEGLGAVGDWALPAVVVCTGTFLNARFTRRLPLIAAWLTGFAAQAAVRHFALGAPLAAAWLPMTGVAFILFTFYMVTDPATTPAPPRAQVAFGATVAAAYGVLMTLHVVFGLFFALSLVCAARGAWAYAVVPIARALLPAQDQVRGTAPVRVPALAGVRRRPALAVEREP